MATGWLTGDKATGRIAITDADGKSHVYTKKGPTTHRKDWTAVWRGSALALGYGVQEGTAAADMPNAIVVGEDTGGWEGNWPWFEYVKQE